MTSTNNSIQFALKIKNSRLIFFELFIASIMALNIASLNLMYHRYKLPVQSVTKLIWLKNGDFTTNVKFTTDDASHPVVLRIRKQHLLCKNCHFGPRIKSVQVK